MTTEELIITIARIAPRLDICGVRVLLALVSRGVSTGTNEVTASHNQLRDLTGLSREGVARGLRNLAMLIDKRGRAGFEFTFVLPEDWFPDQRPLFTPPPFSTDPEDGAWDVSTQAPSPLPGNTQPRHGDMPGTTMGQAPTSLDRTQISPGISHNPGMRVPINIATQAGRHIRNAGARVDRSIEGFYSGIEALVVIDRAFHTVEILPDQAEAADIVADALRICRLNFDSDAYASSRPDRKVIARILAIAPIEDICYVLRTIAEKRTRPGDSDMWFFTVLLHRIHSIPAATTASRIRALSSKAQSLSSKPSLFPDQLVKETAAQLRKLG